MPDSCCDSCGLERTFDRRTAERDLRDYVRDGPDRTTAMLIDALRARGVEGLTLLDIGGGVGVIQHELLAAGASTAVDVDASSAYLEVAREESARRGTSDRVTALHGDFVTLAPQVDPADIVTLDRVICCYGDVEGLVRASAERAHRLYGAVYPRDRWIFRALSAMDAGYTRLFRRPLRFYVHRTATVEGLLAAAGLRPVSRSGTFFWQVVLFERG